MHLFLSPVRLALVLPCSLLVRLPGPQTSDGADALGPGFSVPDLHLKITVSGRTPSPRPLGPTPLEANPTELEVAHAWRS